MLPLSLLSRYNNRTYKIDDLDFDLSPSSTFTNHSGEEQTFLQYYSSTHNIAIGDRTQPLIVTTVRKAGPAGAKDRDQEEATYQGRKKGQGATCMGKISVRAVLVGL